MHQYVSVMDIPFDDNNSIAIPNAHDASVAAATHFMLWMFQTWGFYCRSLARLPSDSVGTILDTSHFHVFGRVPGDPLPVWRSRDGCIEVLAGKHVVGSQTWLQRWWWW
jgi:hypothetical protein